MGAILTRDQNRSEYATDIETETLFTASGRYAPEEVNMGIAVDGMSFVLDMLSDLSVNRGAYALREAYSNAYDATRATGDMTRPIEIEISSLMDSSGCASSIAAAVAALESNAIATVRIIDHGIGMTPDEVKRYFLQYGGSNKRSNADSIGSKGLGSKAPLAVSDAFLVESTRDGITTSALIERANGKNVASVSTREAEDASASGTTVTLPIPDEATLAQIEECARMLVNQNLDATIVYNGEKTYPSFVEKRHGSILHVMNISNDLGEHPSIAFTYLGKIAIGEDEDGSPIEMRCWCRSESIWRPELHCAEVNIGGVNYELDYGRRGWAIDFVIAGEPGYLNFTPSRDEIKDDDAKRRFMGAVKKALEAYDYSHIRNEILSEMSLANIKRNGIFFTPFEVRGDVVFSGTDSIGRRDAFVRDGIDYLPLFMGDPRQRMDGEDGTFRVIYRQQQHAGGTCRPIFAIKGLSTPARAEVSKKMLAEEAIPASPMRELFAWFADGSDDVAVLTQKAGEEGKKQLKRFLRNEAHFTELHELGNTYYVLAEEGYVPSELDAAVFESNKGETLFFDMNEAIEDAIAYKKRKDARERKVAALRAAKASKPEDDASAMSDASYAAFYEELLKEAADITDLSKLPAIDADLMSASLPAAKLDMADAGFAGLARKCALVLDPDVWHYWELRSKTLAVLAGQMRARGEIPQGIEMVAVCSKAKKSHLQRFVDAGGIIIGDARPRAASMATTGIDVHVNDYGTIMRCDPRLVMEDADAAAADMGSAALLAIELRRAHRSSLGLALLDMLDEGRFEGVGLLKEAISTLNKVGFWTPNIFYTTTTEMSESHRKALALWESIKGASKEILGAFEPKQFRDSYECFFSVDEKIAKLMSPGANEMFAKYLAEHASDDGQGETKAA